MKQKCRAAESREREKQLLACTWPFFVVNTLVIASPMYAGGTVKTLSSSSILHHSSLSLTVPTLFVHPHTHTHTHTRLCLGCWELSRGIRLPALSIMTGSLSSHVTLKDLYGTSPSYADNGDGDKVGGERVMGYWDVDTLVLGRIVQMNTYSEKNPPPKLESVKMGLKLCQTETHSNVSPFSHTLPNSRVLSISTGGFFLRYIPF